VLASAAKTRRLLVAHEAIQAGGFGAEIAATVAEALLIPVRRLGAPRVPVGYSRPLEDEARITSDKILAQVVALCGAGGRERSAAPR
jgi:acetoin:2,6-dichlorophenolindophenol oxidoreductase subunit beta